MGRKKTRMVRWQDGSFDATSDNYKEIKSEVTYTDWLTAKENAINDTGDIEFHELPSANPDKLSDEACMWEGGEAYPDPRLQLLGAAVAQLTSEEKDVWELVHVQGRTIRDAAEELSLSVAKTGRLAIKSLRQVRRFMGVAR